jgi:hypothetical protein
MAILAPLTLRQMFLLPDFVALDNSVPENGEFSSPFDKGILSFLDPLTKPLVLLVK